ncbi:hypothetical protein L195_g004737 [Trifolium pratense]|uniref:Uncharacterized protein n=1 Tax=Trifolium pratense TaxID=57577 RepID=A0A2K3NYY2_TRIPR|nr:hypothetical protein L195_g004737 [Trifolium pratense]
MRQERATFVLFDQDVIVLLNKSYPNEGTLPKPIANLKGQSFLFKVEVDSENGGIFQPSYKDSEKLDPLDKGKAVVVDSGVADVAHDLLQRFSEASPDFETGSMSLSVCVVDLDANAEETPNNKRSRELDPDYASKQILMKV